MAEKVQGDLRYEISDERGGKNSVHKKYLYPLEKTSLPSTRSKVAYCLRCIGITQTHKLLSYHFNISSRGKNLQKAIFFSLSTALGRVQSDAKKTKITQK